MAGVLKSALFSLDYSKSDVILFPPSATDLTLYTLTPNRHKHLTKALYYNRK